MLGVKRLSFQLPSVYSSSSDRQHSDIDTVWRIRGKIIRTAFSPTVSYIPVCTLRIGSSYNFRFRLFLGFVFRRG